MKTFIAKEKDIKRKWYIVDANGKILGRMATRIATILRGKNKPEFTPHIDCGDSVIVINASKIATTGNKLYKKEYRTYTGYPGGLRSKTLNTMLKHKPKEVIRHAVKGMLPKGPLGTRLLKKLKVYSEDKHLHSSQNPEELKI